MVTNAREACMTGPGSCKPLVVCIFGVQICTLPFAETGPAGWRAECWNSFGAAASGTEYALGPGLRCEASSINSSSGRTNSWSVTLNVPPYRVGERKKATLSDTLVPGMPRWSVGSSCPKDAAHRSLPSGGNSAMPPFFCCCLTLKELKLSKQ